MCSYNIGMLLELFPSLNQNKLIILLNKFFYSIYYLIFIALLTAISCIFGIEMYAYYIYIFCGGLFPCLFCKDMTPVFAPLGMAYSSVSLKTNNALEHKSLFGDRWYHLYIILALIAAVILPRLIYELVTKKDVRKYKPYLLVGYLIFGVTLILGGLTSPYYSKENAIFGLVEFLSLSGCYIILMYIIKWKEMKKDYLFYLLMFYGLALSIEVFASLILTGGSKVQTGWGIDNNVAGQLCICISAPMYLAIKKKFSPIYVFIADFLMLATSLTNSRTGTLFAMVLTLGTFAIAMVKADKKHRIAILIASLSFAVVFFSLFFIFIDFSKAIYHASVFRDSAKPFLSGRDKIWRIGFEGLEENYPFGVGWYYLTGYRSHNFTFRFIPSRYHNTFVQLVASTGVFGLVAYIYHRYQTIRLTFTKPTLEKTFMFLAISGILLTSIFDCHFFNLGPGLDYCIILAFIEGVNIKEGIQVKRPFNLKSLI